MAETRPNPGSAAGTAGREAGHGERGQLKIFFGAYVGVGKTYAMLQAARQQQEDGVAVSVGVVETHEREETRRLLAGLPQIPPRAVEYRGRTLHEFDLDGALAARPGLILVDELAHANLPGSRHAKRWQDVEELLRAGIDVYTTLNVQHLESLSDVVGSITGMRVQETVPDHVFDTAADVVLVDLPPDDLLARLYAGRIYFPVAAERARRNFFREGNLVAMRELALRRVADRVNSDIRNFRIRNAAGSVLAARERLIVCVDADRAQAKLLREGARLAQHMQADWIAVHVDRPGDRRNPGRREAIAALAELAENLGAEFTNLPGDDVAQTLADYGRMRNATKFVLGHGRRRILSWRPRLVERIARLDPGAGVVLLDPGQPRGDSRRPATPVAPTSHFRPLALATLACAATTLVASGLLRVFDLSNVVMLFLIMVVFVALRLGRVAGAWSAFLSVASFDFFFVAPRLSFAVSDTQYLFTFALMLAVSLVTSQLAARLHAEARVATAGERRASTVARVARALSGASKPEQIVAISAQTIAPLFSARIALLLPDTADRLIAGSQDGFVDLPVAQWVYDHAEPAGPGTQTLASAEALYLPLKAPIRPRGVLALRPDTGAPPSDPDDRRLLDACCSSIALALERIHFVEIAQETLVRMEGERLRNALLAAVSHDLKTPLTAIRGMAGTLEQPGALTPPEQLDFARAIRLQAEELQRLVTNLLDLARMQSEGVRLNKEWHALGEIVGSALAQAGPALAGRQVRTSLPPDLPLIELDATLFERVLVNLIDNAAKYTFSDSTILMRAAVSGETMLVAVEDDGPGLPTADAEILFEPFKRGRRESAIAGVGLGLALCRSIVAAHGGTIRAEPNRPRGARFEIRLPLGAPPEIESEVSA